jgi:hypothetical protein
MVLFVAPPLLLGLGLGGVGGDVVAALGAGAWAAATLAYLPTVLSYRLVPAWAFTLPLAGALYGAMTIDSAVAYARGRRGVW